MVILRDFASHLIYYTHKKVTHEYNNWRRLDERQFYCREDELLQAQERSEVKLITMEDLYK